MGTPCRHMIISLLLFGCCLSMPAAAPADEEERPRVDKSVYTLFNPTPEKYMREFQTDRPDITETPYTLDAGHFAIEMGVFSDTCNNVGTGDLSRPQHRIIVADTNFKVGVLNNMDLQFIFQSFVWERFKTGADTREDQSGFGNTQIRAKFNLWGNDEGKTAMAVMPWVGLPTNRVGDGSNKFTGGVIVPFAFEAPHDFTVGIMTEMDAINNASGAGHHLEWINTLVIVHDLYGEKLEGFVEFASNNSFDTGSPWAATVDLGLVYKVNKDLFLDAGVNIGVTPDTNDLQPFVGFSRRF